MLKKINKINREHKTPESFQGPLNIKDTGLRARYIFAPPHGNPASAPNSYHKGNDYHLPRQAKLLTVHN